MGQTWSFSHALPCSRAWWQWTMHTALAHTALHWLEPCLSPQMPQKRARETVVVSLCKDLETSSLSFLRRSASRYIMLISLWCQLLQMLLKGKEMAFHPPGLQGQVQLVLGTGKLLARYFRTRSWFCAKKNFRLAYQKGACDNVEHVGGLYCIICNKFRQW